MIKVIRASWTLWEAHPSPRQGVNFYFIMIKQNILPMIKYRLILNAQGWPDCSCSVIREATTAMLLQDLSSLIWAIQYTKSGNRIIINEKQITNNEKCFWLCLEITNCLQALNLLIVNTPMMYMIFVLGVFIVCFYGISKVQFQLNKGTPQLIIHLTASSIMLKISFYSHWGTVNYFLTWINMNIS